MRRVFLILVLLAIISCMKFHHEMKHRKRHGFRHKLHELRRNKFHELRKHFHKKRFHHWWNRQEKEEIPESHEEIAKKVNELKTTWTATVYKRDFKPLLGAILEGGPILPEKKTFTETNALPEEYDPRTRYPNCESLREIRDQANCGSCWAFGAVEAMSDRICIKSGETDQRRVSAQNLLSCCGLLTCGLGCNGGFPSGPWSYWKSTGLVTGGLYGDKSTCQPYFLPPCDHHVDGSHGACADTTSTPSCKKNCDDGNKANYNSDLMYASSAYSVSGENNIMQEIYENGPVEGSFTVYDDFPTYRSGVYYHVTGSQLGGHAIKILGGGVENGVKYWLCANSWNEEWGDNGFFKIRRGTNECGIEKTANAGLPKL